MNTNKITNWTIGECCTKATGVVLSHFRGTATEVQILLLKMVKQLKNIDSGEYVHGTETLKELTSEHEEYTAAAVFWSYEVKITAKETCHIKEITDKYVAGDFKATDEKMQELKKGLKSNHEALENFLGVKLSSLGGMLKRRGFPLYCLLLPRLFPQFLQSLQAPFLLVRL